MSLPDIVVKASLEEVRSAIVHLKTLGYVKTDAVIAKHNGHMPVLYTHDGGIYVAPSRSVLKPSMKVYTYDELCEYVSDFNRQLVERNHIRRIYNLLKRDALSPTEAWKSVSDYLTITIEHDKQVNCMVTTCVNKRSGKRVWNGTGGLDGAIEEILNLAIKRFYD